MLVCQLLGIPPLPSATFLLSSLEVKNVKNNVVGITVDRNNEPIQNEKYMFVKLKQGHDIKLCNYG
jgi:hypothetical protein